MILYLVGGFILGVLVTVVIGRTRVDGDLVVYISDYPDEPMYPQLEGNTPLETLIAKKRAKFNVVTKALCSQK